MFYCHNLSNFVNITNPNNLPYRQTIQIYRASVHVFILFDFSYFSRLTLRWQLFYKPLSLIYSFICFGVNAAM